MKLRETVISIIGWIENQHYKVSKHIISLQNESPTLDRGVFRLNSEDRSLLGKLIQ